MNIYWKTDKLKAEFEDLRSLNKKYDKKVVKKIIQRLAELRSFPSYDSLPVNTGKHSIKNGRKLLYFAVDLPSINSGRGRLRLIFSPAGEYDLSNPKTIVDVTILGIIDYH